MVVRLYVSALWWTGDLSRAYPTFAGIGSSPPVTPNGIRWQKTNEWYDRWYACIDWCRRGWQPWWLAQEFTYTVPIILFSRVLLGSIETNQNKLHLQVNTPGLGLTRLNNASVSISLFFLFFFLSLHTQHVWVWLIRYMSLVSTETISEYYRECIE